MHILFIILRPRIIETIQIGHWREKEIRTSLLSCLREVSVYCRFVFLVGQFSRFCRARRHFADVGEQRRTRKKSVESRSNDEEEEEEKPSLWEFRPAWNESN